MSIAAAHLGMTDFADATRRTAIPSGATMPRPGANTSFEPLKQMNAGLLNVGYAEAGPANGSAVILLQGWPYDIHKLRRCRTFVGIGGLPGDRAASARLWHDALSFQ